MKNLVLWTSGSA